VENKTASSIVVSFARELTEYLYPVALQGSKWEHAPWGQALGKQQHTFCSSLKNAFYAEI